MIKISKEQKSWDVHGVPMSAHPKMFGQSSLRDHKNGGQLFFMSNMYPCHITYKGYEYECAEAAIQAQKYPGHEKEFRNLLYGVAKSYGRKYRARGDWRDISLDVLLGVVRAKFQQNHHIATQLVQFQGTIVELNSWGDDFYGVVKDPRQPNVAIGSNCLGQALTIVRNELIAAGVNTANTDGATASGTSIHEASKDTSAAEAKNKVSKEETKMLLKNKEELLSAFGQKTIPATDQIENGVIVARGEGLTRGLIETENGIAKRNGVTPEILATLEDPTAQYVFDGKDIIVETLGKSVARYTGNVKLSESAARPKTTKGFFGAVFKVITDGGLQLTKDKVIAVDSESKDVYAVKTTDGFDFSNFITGDETSFKITKEGIEAWLEVAGEGELFAVTFKGPQQPEDDEDGELQPVSEEEFNKAVEEKVKENKKKAELLCDGESLDPQDNQMGKKKTRTPISASISTVDEEISDAEIKTALWATNKYVHIPPIKSSEVYSQIRAFLKAKKLTLATFREMCAELSKEVGPFSSLNCLHMQDNALYYNISVDMKKVQVFVDVVDGKLVPVKH